MAKEAIFNNFPLLNEIAQNKAFKNIWLFCKDGNAGYLDGNEQVAEDLGLSSIADLRKKTDYSFGWSEKRIAFLRDWDIQVLNKEIGIYKVEDPFLLPCGKFIEILSYKVPLRNKEERIIGLAGISFKLNEWESSTALIQYLNPKTTNNLHIELIKKAGVPFTYRETEIFHYLIQGKSAREIGHLLYISNRTVECHISSMKEKMHCRKKSELIDKVLKLLAT